MEKNERREFVFTEKQTVQSETNLPPVGAEGGGEFTLPDYLPKMQKILRVSADVLPPTRYLSGAEAEWSGDLLHTLIYLGEDGEMGATVLPSKYTCTTPIPTDADAASMHACVRADAPSLRVRDPRKLHLRTKVTLSPSAVAVTDVSEDLPESVQAEKLYGEIPTLQSRFWQTADVSVSDVLDGEADTDFRPIWCGASAAVTDAHTADGGTNVRGEVEFRVLLANGGQAKMLTKKTPFEEFVEGDVARTDGCTATATVLSTEVGREPGSERLLADAALSLCVRTDTENRVRVLYDVYSPERAGEVTYREVPTERLLADRTALIGASGSLTRAAAGAAGAEEVFDTCGRAVLEDVTPEGGKVILRGHCDLQSVFRTSDGYASGAYTLPFKLTLDAETPQGAAAQAQAALQSVRARLDGDTLYCDMEIALSLHLTARDTARIVASADFTGGTPYEKGGHSLTLLYPDGESVWSVAKENHISPESVIAVNGLHVSPERYDDPSALSGVRTLLIESK